MDYLERQRRKALKYLKSKGLHVCDPQSRFQYRDSSGQPKPRPQWLESKPATVSKLPRRAS